MDLAKNLQVHIDKALPDADKHIAEIHVQVLAEARAALEQADISAMVLIVKKAGVSAGCQTIGFGDSSDILNMLARALKVLGDARPPAQ